ncbi:MAG: hypothetical protein K2R93_10470 [Gemmatimonadaceae bacterium]|nr:hypothetical protein [Gemmatimonadaceae bacterium]
MRPLLPAALALAACSRSAAPPANRPVVGIVQVSSLAILDETRAGLHQALADSGFVADRNIRIIERNAQGDIPTLSLILNEFLRQGVTHVAPLSSVATQTALKIITDRPIVFGAVANPYVIGAGTSPTSHRPTVTGAAIPQPADSALALAVRAFPAAKVWGTLYDPADPFAEHYMTMARETAKALGIRFVLVACTSPQDIATGVQALRAQGVDGIMQIPSIMIGGGFSALIKAARELHMPVVPSNTGYVGAPMALGNSFYDNGYSQGLLLIKVLRGADPATVPFAVTAKDQLIIDLRAARDFGVTIADSIVQRAAKVIPLAGDSAASRAATPVPANASAAAPAATSPWAFWFSAVVLGLAFSSLAWGVYIASRVLRFPDISPDGTLPLGAAVCAMGILAGLNPWLATLAALVVGMAAGYVTGVLHTRFAVAELLAGILVMTALYSVNLHVMGRSNLSLLDQATVATQLRTLVPAMASWSSDATFGAVFALLALLLGVTLTWFLRTVFGMALRAVGDNAAMITAQGVDRRGMVEFGLALANGLVALSGALIAQYQGFADVTMGVGTLVAGMAAVILGETLQRRTQRLGTTIAMAAVGAILFRLLIALALRIGLDPVDLKLATAGFVLLTLTAPALRRRLFPGGRAS